MSKRRTSYIFLKFGALRTPGWWKPTLCMSSRGSSFVNTGILTARQYASKPSKHMLIRLFFYLSVEGGVGEVLELSPTHFHTMARESTHFHTSPHVSIIYAYVHTHLQYWPICTGKSHSKHPTHDFGFQSQQP